MDEGDLPYVCPCGACINGLRLLAARESIEDYASYAWVINSLDASLDARANDPRYKKPDKAPA